MDPAAYKLFWGDTHHNIFVLDHTVVDVDRVCRTARDHLDFVTMAYYTPELTPYRPDLNPPGTAGFRVESWKSQERLDREWPVIQDASRRHNEDGRFVAFPGYEWQGNSTSGDHNVVYHEEGPPIYRVDTLAELYACLRRHQAIAIPHHTAYLPGMRGKDWSVHDEKLTPFAEVFSVHGCSETDEGWVGMWHNRHMGPSVGDGTYAAALRRGLHVGAICSGDSFGHGTLTGSYGTGLMAVLATELTRESLWEAFGARRVYGVTGDRIELQFTVDGSPMGSAVECRGPRKVHVAVRGLDAIDRIELLRNERVIATHCHQGTWDVPASGARSRFVVRIESGWGPGEGELEVGDHGWSGVLRVSEGRFVRSVPCWVTHGQKPVALDGAVARFAMNTEPTRVHLQWQNANVFEFEATPQSTIGLRLNGMESSGTVAELMAGSKILWYRQECVEMLQRLRGLTPAECSRGDPFYHMAHKAKIHQVMPESAYTAVMDFVDDEPLAAEAWYRVRVEQRNGQRAWSSPVWVSSAT